MTHDPKYLNKAFDPDWVGIGGGGYAPKELQPGDIVTVYVPKTSRFKDWGQHELKVIAVAVKGVGEQTVTASAPGYGSFRFSWKGSWTGMGSDCSPKSRLRYSFVSRPG